MSNLPADFKPITLQHIFNLAWQAFVVEKRPPAMTVVRGCITTRDPDEWACAYLTNDGKKCAVGLALPDGHPSQKEQLRVAALREKYPDLFDESIPREIINELQSALHDRHCYHGAWRDDHDLEGVYRRVASDFGLTIPGEPS